MLKHKQKRDSDKRQNQNAKIPMRLSQEAAKANSFNKVRWERPNALGNNAFGNKATGKSKNQKRNLINLSLST